MRYHYLTVEREYGSGATEIGNRLSEKMGIPCYGKEILEKVAKDNYISVKQIEAYEEKATNSFLYSIYLMSHMNSGESNLASVESNIFLAQQRVIQDFARHGDSIFIGHCAAYALKERSDVLRVFIHGEYAYRLSRAIQEYGIPLSEAEQTMKYYDKKRENYYKANTSAHWKSFDEYDLVLNSGKLGVQECVEVLERCMKGDVLRDKSSL